MFTVMWRHLPPTFGNRFIVSSRMIIIIKNNDNNEIMIEASDIKGDICFKCNKILDFYCF